MAVFSCFFIFIFFTGTAAAVEEITQEHIKSFSLEAPEGLSLSGVELYNLDPNSNTSIVLNNYGEIYTLQINSTKNWGFWWNFDVSLTTPNGSIEHKTLKSGTLTALNYDVHIQYYWQALNSSVETSYFDIDLYTGILPLEATLQDYNPTKTTPLQFSQVSATSTSYYDLICYAVTPEEFEKQLNNDPLAPLTELTGDFFSWSWSMILSFVEKNPRSRTLLGFSP
ncbi:hypothetical protein [Methanosarcina horonobensis]|uniref:hypothetical protein n=1 Tax=Methanosarcina horonobensis TaxID=418008 RepID=UPI000AA0F6B3|nr:hypothetical protein [Methanosarcina horonobensis]